MNEHASQKNKSNHLVLIIIMLLCVVLLAFFLPQIIRRAKDSRATAASQALIHKYESPATDPFVPDAVQALEAGPVVETESFPTNKEDMIDLAGLRSENPDVWCVLRVPGTVIDYPVMIDTTGTDKYFDHDFFGNESRSGCIYTDKGTTFDQSNILLYGHHMRNGSMFGSLARFSDRTFLDDHKELKLISDGGLRRYEIIGYFTIAPEDPLIEQHMGLYFKADYDTLNNAAAEHGYLVRPLDPEKKYISLVTCEYTRENGRAVVIGENTENISFGR